MELNLRIRSPARTPPTERVDLNAFLDEQRLTQERLKTIDEKLKKYKEDWGIVDSDNDEEEDYGSQDKEKKRDGWIFKGIDNRNVAVLIDTTRDMIDYLKEIGTQLLRFLAKKSKPFKFNLIAFSGELDPFVESPIDCTQQSLELAKTWLEGTIRTRRMSSARGEMRNTLEALVSALGEDVYDCVVLITSGLPEQKSSTVLRCAEHMNKGRPVHIVYATSGNQQPFSTGAFLYSIAQKTNGIFRKLDMSSTDRPVEDCDETMRRTRSAMNDDTARSCEMYNDFLKDSIDNMSLQDDGYGSKKRDFVDYRKFESMKFPAVAESTVSSVRDESPSSMHENNIDTHHVEDAKTSLLRLKLRIGQRPNQQANLEVDSGYRYPVALTLMKGRSVLAKRSDGFHHLGVIADVVDNEKFSVLFDESGKSSPEEVHVADVISYDDAVRHPISVGDSVLAPRMSDDHFSRATVVKKGDTVTVKFEDGTFEILPRDSVIWLASGQDSRSPLQSSLKSSIKPMYAKSEKKNLSSGSSSEGEEDQYIAYLEKQRRKKLKKAGKEADEQDERLQKLQEENDNLKKKLDEHLSEDSVEVREAKPVKSPGSRRRRNPYDDPSLSYDSGLASEGDCPSGIQPGRPYHGADKVWRRSLSAKEYTSAQPRVRVASVPVDEVWGQGPALHEWHHARPNAKCRIAAPVERMQRPQSANGIHSPYPPSRPKHRKSKTDTKPLHSKKWQDTYQVNYGGGGRKILPDTSLYRSQKKEVRFTHDPNRPKHVEYHSADGVPFPRKTDRQFYAKPSTWGPGIEENHPYRHHDIIAHRTVDFPNQQPAVETQYKPGSRPAYNCSAKKVESKPAQYAPDDGPRNLRISHENDTHDKIRITIESEGKKLKYKSQAKEEHSNFEYDREHSNQMRKHTRTDALRQRNKGYSNAETAREHTNSSAADHKEALRRAHDAQRNEEGLNNTNAQETRDEQKLKHLQKTRKQTDARFNALRKSRDQNRDMNSFVDGHAYDRSRSYVLP